MTNPYLNTLLAKADKGNLESVEEIVNYYYEAKSKTKSEIISTLKDKVNNQNSAFLHNLAILGETGFFKILLDEGVKFNNKDNEDNTPLHTATEYKQHKIMNMLLKEDVRYSKKRKLPTDTLMMHEIDENGISPLSLANDRDSFNLFKTYEQRFLLDKSHSRLTEPKLIYSSYKFSPKYPYPSYTLDFKDVVLTGSQYDWISKSTGQIIDTSSPGEGFRLCSGVNIGKNYFLTAGHCLGDVCYAINKEESINYKISFNYQHAAIPKTFPASEAIQENLYRVERVIEHGTCANGVDYAIFELEPDAEKHFGTVKMNADIPKRGENIVIAHHPDGMPKKISLGKITDYDPTAGKVTHTAHTLGGSSGAPIGRKNSYDINAIHVAGRENDQASHSGVTIREIASKSKVVDKMGKFGLYKQPNTRKVLPTHDDVNTLEYRFKRLHP